MEFALIGLVAALASALTLFSGFGLGTLLLPAFALYLPVEVAVAATAIVHLLNNLLKGSLLRSRADWPTVLRFGLPAIPAAILGGWLLGRLAAPGAIVGVTLMSMAVLELTPWFQRLRAPSWAMPIGGALTGLLGGLTGQQGALRSVFLLRAHLPADRFIATGVMIAVLIDLSRLATYAISFQLTLGGRELVMIGIGAASAVAASAIMVRRIDKVTIGSVRLAVAAVLFGIGAALALGLIGDPS